MKKEKDYAWLIFLFIMFLDNKYEVLCVIEALCNVELATYTNNIVSVRTASVIWAAVCRPDSSLYRQ
jgi:hypothetical protein